MSQFPWLGRAFVLAVHDAQIAEHGGAPGLRDDNLLESALARPRHLHAYGSPDAFDLAAAYAFGIARNHPFVDGNKRTAFVVSVTFLRLLGYSLLAPRNETVAVFLALGAGELDEAGLAGWFRAQKVDDGRT